VLDGFQTLRLLREKQETASLPVIMLTASKREGDVLEGWKTGVDYYLTKPFDVQELVAAIRRVLESKAMEGEQT
jgi:DNA-binding response OmpR family regulator